jgi:hypothetical protein
MPHGQLCSTLAAVIIRQKNGKPEKPGDFIIRTGEVISIGRINKNRDINRYILND